MESLAIQTGKVGTLANPEPGNKPGQGVTFYQGQAQSIGVDSRNRLGTGKSSGCNGEMFFFQLIHPRPC